MSECEHQWQYGGLVYSHSDRPLPGGGAYARIYEDWFYCQHCLAGRHANPRTIGNSYEKPIDGALPK